MNGVVQPRKPDWRFPEGEISANYVTAEAGDGLAIADQTEIAIEAGEDSVVLIVETV